MPIYKRDHGFRVTVFMGGKQHERRASTLEEATKQERILLEEKERLSPEASFSERFWDRVKKGGAEQCWPWTGAIVANGYGRAALTQDNGTMNRSLLAHRVAWELANGRKLRPKMVVMHTCDNPPCCNPAHLREASSSENALDAFAKGRRRFNPRRPKNFSGCQSG